MTLKDRILLIAAEALAAIGGRTDGPIVVKVTGPDGTGFEVVGEVKLSPPGGKPAG